MVVVDFVDDLLIGWVIGVIKMLVEIMCVD